jgi:tetratricopeptide (TPR) repeat protein
VTGAPDDLVRLTDDATFAILGQIWRRGDPPAPNLAGITTHSVEALRAYLEGERAFVRADFDVAVAAFDRAFAADSTFWFAYWRSLYPRVYEGSRPDSAAVSAVIAHRAEFPPADRLLIESRLADSLSETLAILRDVTARFPTYWPASYMLANTLVHEAPFLGTTFEDARAALERVVALNPSLTIAWDHLTWYGAFLRDTALAARTQAALAGLAEAGSYRMTPDRASYYAAALTLARQDGRFTPVQRDTIAEFLLGVSTVSPMYLGIGMLDFRFPQAQVALNDAVLARSPPRPLAAGMWLGKALSWATRGGWPQAVEAAHEWLRITDMPDAPLRAYGLAVIGAHLGSVDPAAAARFRPESTDGATSPDERAERAWLDGILARARGDAAGLDAARRDVRTAGGAFSSLLEESLAAFALDLGGDAADAARRLATLEWAQAQAQTHHRYGRHHPFLMSVHRLAAARGLFAAGDTAQADRLLTWTDAVLWNAHGFMDFVLAVFEPLALYERARIAAARNRTADAAALYRRFLERYDRPEGDWTGRVEEAIGAARR